MHKRLDDSRKRDIWTHLIDAFLGLEVELRRLETLDLN